MSVLTAPLAVVAVAVAIAALAKLRDPRATTGALRSAGVPASDAAVRVGALVELCVAMAALAGSRVALAALAVSYAAFATFVVLALTSGRPGASCGCVGRMDAPPSLVHVVLDIGAAAVALVACVGGAPSVARVLARLPAPEAGALVALVAIGAGLFLVAITSLPAALALRAPTRS